MPTNCFDISMGLENQIKLIQGSQDAVIREKLETLNQGDAECPHCQSNLVKFGKQNSTLHDVLTDHQVNIHRLKYKKCGYELPSTIRTLS